MRILKIVFIFLLVSAAEAQITHFPYFENFDAITPPSLPSGWSTTTNRQITGDFITTTSTAFSPPYAVISTNATIGQNLTSPLLDFSNREADSLIFYERRSSSHNSDLILEASLDGGSSFFTQIGDTLKNPGVTSYVRRNIKIPSSLTNQSMVKIRWRIVGNGTGSTGTLRFDNVTISARAQYDIGIIGISTMPLFPRIGDSVVIRTTLKNLGTQQIENTTVNLFNDIDSDSIPDESELFSSSIINQSLQPDDTISVETILAELTSSNTHIIVEAVLSNDQNLANNIKHVSLMIEDTTRSLIINEIMFAPSPGKPEWIELFNTSSINVDLRNWKLSNRNSSTKYTISPTPFIVAPQSYLVVTKAKDNFDSAYGPISSPVAEIFQMPTFFLNNNGDAVALFDARGVPIDSVRYSPSWGGTGGKSLEKMEAAAPSNDSTNWVTSGAETGSTPGRQNYNTPLEYNLSFHRINIDSTVNTTKTISVIVKNTGKQSVSGFKVSIYSDLNEDSLAQPSEHIHTVNVETTIQPKDSITVNLLWENPEAGRKFLMVIIDFSQDLRRSDDIGYGFVYISFPVYSIVINEIMYEPRAGQSEYIELYNRSQHTIDMHSWKLSDLSDANGRRNEFVICTEPYLFMPGEFLTIAADSSIHKNFPYTMDTTFRIIILNRSSLSLNNEGDAALLLDQSGQVIDSVYYNPSWHNPDIDEVTGRSLERINPNLSSTDRRNWSTSANPYGGTPGKQNSLYTTSIPNNTSISFSPNPFSPDGDGVEDFTVLRYQLSTTSGLVRVRIFDAKGRLIRTLAHNEPSGAIGEIIWDGYNDNREKVTMGIYIVFLEAIDSFGGNVQTMKGVVVVAAKL